MGASAFLIEPLAADPEARARRPSNLRLLNRSSSFSSRGRRSLFEHSRHGQAVYSSQPRELGVGSSPQSGNGALGGDPARKM